MPSVRLKSMYFGSVTFAGNLTSLVVTHNIGQVPSYVFLTQMSSSVYPFYVTSLTSTTFTIAIRAQPTSSVIIQWLALVDP